MGGVFGSNSHDEGTTSSDTESTDLESQQIQAGPPARVARADIQKGRPKASRLRVEQEDTEDENMPAVGGRRRASSMAMAKATSTSQKEGKHRGTNFLLRSRTDVQKAMTWMEGWDNFVYDVREHFDMGAKTFKEKYQLPLGLIGSFLLGAACLLTVQRSFVEDLLGPMAAQTFWISAVSLFAITMAALTYCGLCDPGQLSPEIHEQCEKGTRSPPQRSHKSWQYERPILRFDHYCRWVTNCIGLRNHREFLVMVIGLSLAALAGGLVDVGLAIGYAMQVRSMEWVEAHWQKVVLVVLHFAYSCIFGYYVLPILRLHLGFISRNELANEWKHDEFYIVRDVQGRKVWVGDLDVDEFNELFDTFQYDKTRNKWDRSCPKNWWAFLTTSRCSVDQLGEF